MKRYRERWVVAAVFFGFAWREIQRRLDVLNHAHEQALEVQRTYVSKQQFDDRSEQVDERERSASKALQLAEGAGTGRQQFWAILVSVVMAGLVAASVMVGLLAISVTIVVYILSK